MGFVAAQVHLKEYGETASLILQMAAEMGISKFDLKTVSGGFEVPDAISDILNGTHAPPPVTAPSGASGIPPAWWGEELEQPGIEVDAEGKVYLKVTPPEFIETVSSPGASQSEVRAWAQANDVGVAPKGRIAKDVMEAFYASQE